MISYFKTQWFKLLVAIICLGFSIYYAFHPAAETLTVETLDEAMSIIFTATNYFFSFLIWIFMSFISFNSDRIKLLEKKAEKYDALCELVEELRKSSNLDREHIEFMDAKIKHIAKHTDFSKEPIND